MDEYYSKWDGDQVAKRLLQLHPGEDEVVWTQAAGFARGRRLHPRLWEFRPMFGNDWNWVMVGQDDDPARTWKVTFSDGWDAPALMRDEILDAEGALWEAVDFLHHDPAFRREQGDVRELEGPAPTPSRDVDGLDLGP